VGVNGPKVFLYRMETTEGVTREAGLWTPEELREQWGKIGE
jgi:hypothetical protein